MGQRTPLSSCCDFVATPPDSQSGRHPEGWGLSASSFAIYELNLKEGEEVDIEIRSKGGIFGLLKDWKLDSQSLKDELRKTDG